MKWLENNPLGVALASVCGFLLLVSVIIALVWNRPAVSGVDVSGEAAAGEVESASQAADIGPLSNYQEVTDRPLFSESRRPVLGAEADDEEMEELPAGATQAPEVRMMGVVITPDQKMVTLKPASGGDSFIAKEGVPLEGEYAGWMVSRIQPREAIIESVLGDSMKIELAVSNRSIKPPPKAKPASAEQPAPDNDETAGEADQEDAPVSRAEEIRRRIAERREELRREQEERESGEANPRADYQNAIRAMMRQKNENSGSNGSKPSGGG